MGWLDNRLMRGATNRSFNRLAAEFSAGPVMGVLALAMGHACYPKATYGDEGPQDEVVKQLKQYHPRPCDANTASDVVDAWERRTISTADAFQKVWGVNHDEFLARFAVVTAVEGMVDVKAGASYATSDDALTAICDEFARLPITAPEGHANLAQFIEGFKANYYSQDRQLCDAAKYCITRYVESELKLTSSDDCESERIADPTEGFGVKHRHELSSLTESTFDAFRFALSRHIICGHLFLEINLGLPPLDKNRIAKESLLRDWIYRISSPPPDLYTTKGIDDPHLLQLWFSATGDAVHDLAVQNGIAWDGREAIGSDRAILSNYFTAGVLLRYSEAMASRDT